MATSRTELIESIKNYQTQFDIEIEFKNSFLQLLENSRCYFRDHLPGHITGSAWIVDGTRKLTLLTHHAKLNKWLQPGGHADGDEHILNVSLREGLEETGLQHLKLISNHFFDIDIHKIPARNDFPEHKHFDVRFIFEASAHDIITITEESHDLKWVSLDDLENFTTNESILRMRTKTMALQFL